MARREVFVATATGRSTQRRWLARTIPGVVQKVDAATVPHAGVQAAWWQNRVIDVVVRGAYTSDGTYQGVGRGRVVAVREHGKWVRF